jgi:hypothetical protein
VAGRAARHTQDVLRPGEGDGAVPSDQHLRVLLTGTALVWLGTIALAVASETPHLVLALVALLPTAGVPFGFFVDARREHRRLSAEVADLEARLDLLLEAQRLTRRLAALTEDLAATAVEHRHRVLTRPLATREWSAAPGQNREGGASPPRSRTLVRCPRPR